MSNIININGQQVQVRDEFGNATNEYRKLMGDNLYKMYELKNRSDYDGSITKYECTMNNEKGIFKERVSSQSKDHIMEQVCFELANIVGVNCCKASCRKSQGIYGSFSRYEVEDMNNVITLSKVFKAIELSANDLLDRCMYLTKGKVNKFIIDVYKTILFDFITGQRDRHLENISIYRKNSKVVLYPLYDNGICCFATDNNESAITFLDNGFYSSRMGTDEEILWTILKYKSILGISDFNNILNLGGVDYITVYKILKHSDKYNQLSEKRVVATTKFILRQIERLLGVNGYVHK